MTRRIWVVLAAMWFFIVGFYARPAEAVQMGHREPTRYVLQEDLYGMPYRIVLRNCRNAEDTMDPHNWVYVDYSPERVVYRCKSRGY